MDSGLSPDGLPRNDEAESRAGKI